VDKKVALVRDFSLELIGSLLDKTELEVRGTSAGERLKIRRDRSGAAVRHGSGWWPTCLRR
jgi:hypothetical protein